MSRNKVQYHNHLPPLPADCLLPKFTVPHLSTEFNRDSPIHNHIPPNIITDALLGIPIEFADLGLYKSGQDLDIIQTDFMYVPELGAERQELVLPGPVAPVRQHHEPRPQEAPKAAPAKSKYLRSGFVQHADDKSIQEQLENAFDGNVPEGNVILVTRGHPLEAMSAQEMLDTNKTLLMSLRREFLKVVGEPTVDDIGDEVLPLPTRAFSVSGEESKSTSVYFSYDGKGGCQMGEIKKFKLRPLTQKQMSMEEMTATPVKILRNEKAQPEHESDE